MCGFLKLRGTGAPRYAQQPYSRDGTECNDLVPSRLRHQKTMLAEFGGEV